MTNPRMVEKSAPRHSMNAIKATWEVALGSVLICQVDTERRNFNHLQSWFVGFRFETDCGTFPAQCKQCDQVLQGDRGRIINPHCASDHGGSTGYGLWGSSGTMNAYCLCEVFPLPFAAQYV